MSEEHRVLIGAAGWRHTGWRGDFYPQELPADWELTYYGNEFPVVLVPPYYWEDSPQPAADWAEDADPGFRFVCEIPAGCCVAGESAQCIDRLGALREQLAPLGTLCSGLVTPVGIDRLQLTLLLEQLAPHFPLAVDSASLPEDELLELLAPWQAGCVWHGHGASRCMQLGKLALARVDAATLGPRELRAVVEACLAGLHPERSSVLIFEGEPPAIETLRKAGVILDLL